jgi:hypothetical protein
VACLETLEKLPCWLVACLQVSVARREAVITILLAEFLAVMAMTARQAVAQQQPINSSTAGECADDAADGPTCLFPIERFTVPEHVGHPLGSSIQGWFDVLVGCQVFSFGDERVIGPSDWLNMGRTFDTVRVDLHHPGFRISMFVSSVIVGRDSVIDHHIQGNNLHGVYGSLTNVIPHATLEPYVP